MEWIIPANNKYYNHSKAFLELPYVDWKQKVNYSIGDKVFIYATSPTSAIEFLVEVIKVNVKSKDVLDDEKYWTDMEQYTSGKKNSRYVRFKLISHYKKDKITLEQLRDNGLDGNIQSPRKLYSSDGSIKKLGHFIHEYLDDFENKERQGRYVIEVNRELDNQMKEAVLTAVFDVHTEYHYSQSVFSKPEKVKKKDVVVYKRNNSIAINALGIAHFLCEINPEHSSFIRRKDKIRYMEPHHLIPMSYQSKFDSSIDIEENIVSLCSNCHNEIHYGLNARELITKLYNERKEMLASKNIEVSLKQLLSYYRL